jgi:hypothetical protein
MKLSRAIREKAETYHRYVGSAEAKRYSHVKHFDDLAISWYRMRLEKALLACNKVNWDEKAILSLAKGERHTLDDTLEAEVCYALVCYEDLAEAEARVLAQLRNTR